MLSQEADAPIRLFSHDRDSFVDSSVLADEHPLSGLLRKIREIADDRGAVVVNSKRIRVVGAIIRRNDTVFAARRNPDRSAGGLWEFPGGKVEPGETPEEGLARELREELDIEISVGAFIDQSLSEVAGATIELSCYSAELHGAEPAASTDHDAMAWVGLHELEQFEWAPGDVPIIERLSQTLPEAWPTQGPAQ